MSTNPIYISNPAKDRLKAGKPVFGFGVWEFTRPAVVKIAAQAGFHVLIVEAEHELHDEADLNRFHRDRQRQRPRRDGEHPDHRTALHFADSGCGRSGGDATARGDAGTDRDRGPLDEIPPGR